MKRRPVDMAVEDDTALHAKRMLAQLIVEILDAEAWTQEQAAAVLDTDRAAISRLKNGRVAGFKFDGLFRYLNLLNRDVAIQITTATSGHDDGAMTVIV